MNSSLTLVADTRGLVVQKFISNGTDVLASNFTAMLRAPKDGQGWYVQLFPTMLYRNETTQEGEKWRAIVTRVRDEVDRGVFDDFCPTDVDANSYAAMAANEFVFVKGEGEGVHSVDVTGFRVNLVRDREGKEVRFKEGVQEVMEL